MGVFPLLLAFLVWLFANGKFADWASLINVNANSGGATGSFASAESGTQTASKNTDYADLAIKAFDAFGGGGDAGGDTGNDTNSDFVSGMTA